MFIVKDSAYNRFLITYLYYNAGGCRFKRDFKVY